MSGVGRALRIAKSHGAINVGVIGLGSGSLAVYCSPGDSFVFYEIDKRMVFIAEKYFTYVPKCSGTNILLGDARLTIQNELKGAFKPYDLLAVDAFSDDSIPMHLLTKEAIELYLNRIKEDGIVAIHVSNRYLGLAPVVHKIAHTLRIPSLEVTTAQQGEFGSASTWVLLTRNAEYFADPRFADVKLGASSVQGPLWTDDFNALSSVVTIPLPSVVEYFRK
jgi:spermidine synthase